MSFVTEEQQREIRDQKVRILNGAHTGTMAAGFLSGFDTVRETIEDDTVGSFMNEMITNEIVPNIPGDQAYLTSFAEKIVERFYNPFIRHEWQVISLNSMSKWETRVLPSLLDAQKNTGKIPNRLSFSLAALMAFYKGTRGDESYTCKDNQDVLDLYAKEWNSFDGSIESATSIVRNVLSYAPVWKRDLNDVPGLAEAVSKHLNRILNDGALSALKTCQAEATETAVNSR